MNLKTTIALLLLAGGCAALFWKGPELAPRLHLAPQPRATSNAGTSAVIANLPVEEITHVVVDVPDRPKLELKAPAVGKPLELPGNWPIRRSEVAELLSTLHDLKSRYYPIPMDDKTDLKPYGLADEQKPIVVTLSEGGTSQTMKFGEAPLLAGENPFTRATYVRLEGKDEILRLGPHVTPILRRGEETYRRRQLFPEAIRARIGDAKRPQNIPGLDEPPSSISIATFVLSNEAKEIEVETANGRFVLRRVEELPKPEAPADKPDGEETIVPAKLAKAWIIVKPVEDHGDPDKLKAILTAIPDLWVEKFVDAPAADALLGLGSHPNVVPQLFTMLGGILPSGLGDSALRPVINIAALSEAKTGGAKLTVTLVNGKPRTLQIGRASRSVGGNELRYAKIEDNPIVFELKTDKMNDLQMGTSRPSGTSPVDEIRDPVLFRFEADKVAKVEIVSPAAKGNRLIEIEKKGEDWQLRKPVDEPSDKTAVTELLNQLKEMDARGKDIIDPENRSSVAVVAGNLGSVDPVASHGLTPDRAKKITIAFDPKTGLKPVTFLIGKRDSATSKRAVMVEGWSRINLVNDRADADKVSVFDRQPSGYRAVKLFDRLKSKIVEVGVQRGGDSYTLQEDKGKVGQWAITAPFKAEADGPSAAQLVGALSQIDSPKYLHDPKTDDALISPVQWPLLMIGTGGLAGAIDPFGANFYGLEKPSLTVTLKFSEPKGASDLVLEIGRAKSATENFARQKGTTGVFLVPAQIAKSADHKAEELVDKTLIQFAGNAEVQTFKRTMKGEELEIAQNNSALWEVTKPALAKADQPMIDELVNSIRRLRAVRIEAVTPKDLKTYGLEAPVAVVTLEALEKSKLVEKVLSIGNPVDPQQPNGDRYAKAQGSTMVAVIAGELAAKLIAPPFKFRDLSLGGFVSADKIVIDKDGRQATFVKGAGGWKMKEPLETAAEDEALRELHDMLAKLRAEEFVEDKPKDLTKYGLDKPARYRLFNGDKEVLSLLVGTREKIGADKTDGFRAYAKLEKGDTVVLLDPLLTARLASEYRKRDLWEPLPEKEIKEISIKAADDKNSFTLVKGPTGWTDPAKPAESLNPETVNDLIFAVSGLRAERYVIDKGADLKTYGLDKPRTVTITTEGGKKAIVQLGNLFEGKYLYGKLDDPARSDVFLLGEHDSKALNRPRGDYAMPKEEPKKAIEPKKEEKK